MLKTKQVSFFFGKLDVQTLALLMETRVIEYGADLGGILGFSCADLQVSPIRVGCSSDPGCKGIRLDLHKATHDGFHWLKDGVVWEVPMVVAELQPVELMLCSSTFNWVSQICWVLGPAGGETESS